MFESLCNWIKDQIHKKIGPCFDTESQLINGLTTNEITN